ncbi:MAG: molecular chaperone DnaJ [Candidatus Delongbacteria bacterium]|jgi:molecular chaperone DnaJ|nr:molecular chaperone DnaJ [Candidatus Delongbacteria bacterium]
MSKRDYYEILGVDKNATKDDIKKAYKKLALKFHPDRNKGDKDSEEKFKEVGEAYSVLSDDNKRSKYDRFGHEGVRGGSGAGGFDFSGFDFGDAESIFEQFFGRGFGGSSRRRSSSGLKKGTDIQISIKLTLEEISRETSKKIKLNKYVKCSNCNGSGAKDISSKTKCSTCSGTGEIRTVQRSILGQFVNVSPCPHCDGTGEVILDKCPMCSGEGRVREDKTVSVTIPAGVSEGQYLTLSGEGNTGKRGGPSGDLIVIIQEKEHKFFHRDRENLYYDLQLSVPQAVLGTDIEVPVIEGKVKLKVPSGTQSGKKLLLKGKGLPVLNGYGNGDLVVRISIWIPGKLSKKARDMFESLNGLEELKPKAAEKGFFEKIKDRFFE